MKTRDKYRVEVEDLDPTGPEMSDEELRATRGGAVKILISFESSSVLNGPDDFDYPHEL